MPPCLIFALALPGPNGAIPFAQLWKQAQRAVNHLPKVTLNPTALEF